MSSVVVLAQKMEASVKTLALPSKSQGVKSVAVCPNQALLALGTGHGKYASYVCNAMPLMTFLVWRAQLTGAKFLYRYSYISQLSCLIPLALHHSN